MNNKLVDLVDILYPSKEKKPQSSTITVPKLGMSWGKPIPKRETPPPSTKKVDRGTIPLSEYQNNQSDNELIQDTYLLMRKGR